VRNIIYIAVTVILVSVSGLLRAQTVDTFGCALPITPGGLYKVPKYGDMMQFLSPDGKHLGFFVNQGDGGVRILNLQTLDDINVKVKDVLPNEDDGGIYALVWCPHDSDLVALSVSSYVDTSNNNTPVGVGNIFTYRISTGESALISPGENYPYGSAEIHAWLPGSRQGMDSLLVSSQPFQGTKFYGIYVPQTQAMIPQLDPYLVSFPDSSSLSSRDGEHIFTRHTRIDSVAHAEIDSFDVDYSPISFPIPVNELNYASFSINDSLLALSLIPDGNPDSVFDEVWIYAVYGSRSSPFKVIDFQKNYCTYNFKGIWAEFLTDSTLAVSMHKDGDSASLLYEITIDGRIVRQLTFLPEKPSGVGCAAIQASLLSLTSYPDPITSNTTISFTLPEASEATLTLTDAAGRVTLLLPAQYLSAGQHEVTWDATKIPSGVYLCRIKAGGENATQRVVVMH
jgi:hypothetical protein